jgi:hypothetical protein
MRLEAKPGLIQLRDSVCSRAHIIIAFTLAGLSAGHFFQHVTYNAGAIAANVGFTYRF